MQPKRTLAFALAHSFLFAAGLVAGVQKSTRPPVLSTARATLQQAVDREMAGRTGTAVVLDVESGAILAAHRLDLGARRVVFPGSTVKPFVLLALLESKRLSPQDSLLCPLRLRVGENQIDCSHPLRGAAFDPVAALAFSCNNFFAHFAPRLSPADLDAALSRSGMTQPSGLATREATGQIFPSRNRDAHLLKALGEWGVTVTPLGLLAAYRKLALHVQDAPPDEAPLSTALNGMIAVTRYGTGAQAHVEGLEVAGKTGTALAREGRWTHAWFLAFAPARTPKIVMVVFLERGQGGADAAPVANTILQAWKDSQKTAQP